MFPEVEEILTWLLQKEHRVDDSSCFEGEGDYQRREPQGLSEEDEIKGMSGTGKRKPYMESLFNIYRYRRRRFL